MRCSIVGWKGLRDQHFYKSMLPLNTLGKSDELKAPAISEHSSANQPITPRMTRSEASSIVSFDDWDDILASSDDEKDRKSQSTKGLLKKSDAVQSTLSLASSYNEAITPLYTSKQNLGNLENNLSSIPVVELAKPISMPANPAAQTENETSNRANISAAQMKTINMGALQKNNASVPKITAIVKKPALDMAKTISGADALLTAAGNRRSRTRNSQSSVDDLDILNLMGLGDTPKKHAIIVKEVVAPTLISAPADLSGVELPSFLATNTSSSSRRGRGAIEMAKPQEHTPIIANASPPSGPLETSSSKVEFNIMDMIKKSVKSPANLQMSQSLPQEEQKTSISSKVGIALPKKLESEVLNNENNLSARETQSTIV